MLLDKKVNRLDYLIDGQSKTNAHKIAIKHGQKTFTYENVNNTSGRLALYLKACNVKPGDIVGVAVNRSPEMIIALIAIIKAGATYLPIDNRLPVDRINYMLRDCGAKFLMVQNGHDVKNYTGTGIVFLESALENSTGYEIKGFEPEVAHDSIAYILYTSGSTGNPKGVQVKHSSLLNLLESLQEEPGINSSDVVLATTTISFDIAEVELFLPLICGATVVVADAETVKDGRLLIETAKSEGITIMQGTPFMWRNMLESGWEEVLPIKVFCGGEAMTKELATNLLARCNRLWNMYGPTETTIYSLIKEVTPEDKIITIGKPVLNTQVYLLDENLNEVAFGETGEICIGGAGVAQGYVNKPGLTAEKFISGKIHGAGGKIYRSGDLGKMLDNGEIQCLGRIDHQIKIRGFRIETEEIEYQLKRLENVKEALVVLFKDALENMHLVAYVVPQHQISKNAIGLQIKAWKAGLKNVLPEYMVPEGFKVIPAVPLMNNGKVDRKALPDPFVREDVLNEFEPPQTETELLLATIFLKHIALNKIGIADNFFELGIDSLVAVQIMVHIEKQFGKRLPLSTLIKYQTIKQLAQFIDNKVPCSAYKSLIPIKPAGNKPPLYIVHGIGLNLNNVYGMVQNLHLDQPVYGIQSLGLDGEVSNLTRIEDIAKFYTDEIIRHSPTGPYAIVGYSFGGYVAFEMAKQLTAAGKDVKMLGMIDTNIQYPSHQFTTAKRLKIKAARQFKKVIFRAGTFVKQPALTAKYLGIHYSQTTKKYLNKMGFLRGYHPEKLPGFMQEIAQTLQNAFYQYKLKPCNISVDIFKAGTRLYFVDDPKFLGWKDYALGGVNVFEVPGDHKEMLNPPNNKILAEKIQNRLNSNLSPQS